MRERIISGRCEPLSLSDPGVELREFVSRHCEATAFSTGVATLHPESELPYHIHEVSEAITILNGKASIAVEGRTYRLFPHDCIHIPAGAAHRVVNSSVHPLVALSALASAQAESSLCGGAFRVAERGAGQPQPGDPEHIIRFDTAEVYELSKGAFFRDLFGARFGAVGVCGGYGLFNPGASLPCHFHKFDESITIVCGKAVCLVEGTRYELEGYDTAFVPEGRTHRFLNHSEQSMAMIWVYAGSEPERTIVDAGYCSGALVLLGNGK